MFACHAHCSVHERKEEKARRRCIAPCPSKASLQGTREQSRSLGRAGFGDLMGRRLPPRRGGGRAGCGCLGGGCGCSRPAEESGFIYQLRPSVAASNRRAAGLAWARLGRADRLQQMAFQKGFAFQPQRSVSKVDPREPAPPAIALRNG